jgi:N,N-dimethylformamidase beta subunit-like protein
MIRSPHRLGPVPVVVVVVVLLVVARAVASEGNATPPPPTATWQVSAPSSAAAIEGYASHTSVAAGETLELHVSTKPAARYRAELYRIGWYAGQGGSLVGCLPNDCAADEAGTPEPVNSPDPATGVLRAGWPTTDSLTVPGNWRSGYYLAKLVLTSGSDSGKSTAVPFVVRAATGSQSDVLVVEPVNTWQAYNDWGGLSMYTDPRSAVEVSFDRPYAIGDAKPTLDYPVVRFVDQFGYDASYTTDIDIDADPAELARHRLVVFPAHSEYWTKAMRDGLESARAAGVNLAFLGGNTGYWQIRYADATRRTLVEYRSATTDPSPDPHVKTVRWRDAPVQRPECSLIGVQWQGGDDSTDRGPHDYEVSARSLSDRWFASTGFKPGDSVRGAVGGEWDSVAPECRRSRPGLTVLFHYQGRATPQPPGVYTSTFHSTNADAVRYRATSGAVVFAVGSIDFGWTLAGSADGSAIAAGVTRPDQPPDPRLQRFLRNVFDDLTGPRPGLGSQRG